MSTNVHACTHKYALNEHYTTIDLYIHEYPSNHPSINTYIHTNGSYIHAYTSYIHTCIHTYIHTYVHTYIHTCTCTFRSIDHSCTHTSLHKSTNQTRAFSHVQTNVICRKISHLLHSYETNVIVCRMYQRPDRQPRT